MKDNVRPVFEAADYGRVNGRKAGQPGAASLAIGLDEAGEAVIRLREGETSLTLPLHQAADMALLLQTALGYTGEAYRMPKLYDENNPLVSRIGLQGEAMTVKVAVESPTIETDIAALRDVLSKDGELLGERLRRLAHGQ